MWIMGFQSSLFRIAVKILVNSKTIYYVTNSRGELTKMRRRWRRWLWRRKWRNRDFNRGIL